MSLASWTTSGWLTTVWKALTEADGFCDLLSFGGNQRKPLPTHWSKGFYLVQRYSKLLSPSVQPPVKTLQWTNHSDNTSPTAQWFYIWHSVDEEYAGRKKKAPKLVLLSLPGHMLLHTHQDQDLQMWKASFNSHPYHWKLMRGQK